MITRENIKGKIIVFEGLDGCFKETNAHVLGDYIATNFNPKTIVISYPQYKTKSCYFVENYLKGIYGKLNEINPYTAAMCYAVDRLDTKKTVDDLLNEGYTIIFDRYVSSNILYQSTKFDDVFEMDRFIDWCLDLEYDKNKLAKPDITLFMYIPVDINTNLLKKREGKSGILQDIHESNNTYMKQVERSHKYICDKLHWNIVKCYESTRIDNTDLNRILDKEEIFSNILNILNANF